MGALTKVGGAGLLLVVAAGIIWFGDDQPVDVTPRGPDDETRVTYVVEWTRRDADLELVEYGPAGVKKRQRNRDGGRWAVTDVVERGAYVELDARLTGPAKSLTCYVISGEKRYDAHPTEIDHTRCAVSAVAN